MKRFCMLNCRWQMLAIFSWVFFCSYNNAVAQSKVSNKYGLLVIKDINILQKEIELNPEKRMVDLIKFIPGVSFDLKYASRDNFMHERLYPRIKTSYLRQPAAVALKKVVAELEKLNLGIKIFDAYRPYSVTEKMWEAVKDDRYAANPATGSGHNRGVSVDLTIIGLITKKELPMGTGFDNFTDTAHQGFTGLSQEVLKNRNLLKSTMEKFGFIALKTEWWHFYLPDSADYELLDLSFADLKKLDH